LTAICSANGSPVTTITPSTRLARRNAISTSVTIACISAIRERAGSASESRCLDCPNRLTGTIA
jgi:hypothetical protein